MPTALPRVRSRFVSNWEDSQRSIRVRLTIPFDADDAVTKNQGERLALQRGEDVKILVFGDVMFSEMRSFVEASDEDVPAQRGYRLGIRHLRIDGEDRYGHTGTKIQRVGMTSSPAFTPGFPHAGGIVYRPTEATCGFVCSSLGTERGDSDHEWSSHLRHTGRAIDRVTVVCR